MWHGSLLPSQVDLLLFYTPLGHGQVGESWSSWSYLQAAGFAVLVTGTLVYRRGDSEDARREMAEAVMFGEGEHTGEPAVQTSNGGDALLGQEEGRRGRWGRRGRDRSGCRSPQAGVGDTVARGAAAARLGQASGRLNAALAWPAGGLVVGGVFGGEHLRGAGGGTFLRMGWSQVTATAVQAWTAA